MIFIYLSIFLNLLIIYVGYLFIHTDGYYSYFSF